MSKKTNAFITKYALTSGVLTASGEVKDGRFHPDSNGKFYFLSFAIGKDAFLTREEALANADLRRVRKIKSLERQIKALRDMTISVTMK
jgi:hypothetical protein